MEQEERCRICGGKLTDDELNCPVGEYGECDSCADDISED